jgi:hypothetical protein
LTGQICEKRLKSKQFNPELELGTNELKYIFRLVTRCF